MDKALYIFDIVLASEDFGKTNEVRHYMCWTTSYIDALKRCIDHCEACDFAVVRIDENYEAEAEY